MDAPAADAEPRGAYYGKWDRFARDEAAKVKAEEAAEAASSQRALGLGDRGAAAAAAAKRDALRAAKAQWADKQQQEVQAKAWITDRTAGDHVIDAACLAGKEVVHVRDCADCRFELPAAAVLAKLFVERCARCAFTLRGRLITGHLEVWACDDVSFALRAPLPTLQADLCRRLALRYASRAHLGAVVHAGVRGLTLTLDAEDDADASAAGGAAEAAPALVRELAPVEGDAAAEDTQQFITRWVRGALLTERVIRDATDYPTTARELREKEEEGASLHAATSADGGGASADVATTPEEEAALAAALAARRCAVQREAGNEAFRAGDWAAAAVAYTNALTASPGDAAALSNRAAAFLKLGRHEQALADAAAAAAAQPAHAKSHFRTGLALHALGRHAEAAAALSRALDLEPKNAQIRDALRIAEAAIARKARAEAER